MGLNLGTLEYKGIPNYHYTSLIIIYFQFILYIRVAWRVLEFVGFLVVQLHHQEHKLKK